MNLRLMPAVLLLSALAAVSPGAAGRASGAAPNLIIILTDDQGYGDLGCFGSKTIETPRIDRMAAEGLKLTSFYSQPLCGPARAALNTGSYPARVIRRWTVPPSEITLADLLKHAGYATACTGKWDMSDRRYVVGRVPNDQGFDYYYGPLGANDLGSVILYRNRTLLGKTTDMGSLTKLYTDEAIKFLSQQTNDHPFYLYLPYTMPHVQLGASKDFLGKSKAGLYGDAVQEIDWNVGRVLDTIKEKGFDRNTVVVFYSDNGPWLVKRDGGGSAGPLREGKESAYEGGVRVPGIVWGPSLIPGGRVSDEIVASIDLYPTLAFMAGLGVPVDRSLDGVNQSPLFTGKSTKSARDSFLYYTYNGVGLSKPVLSAIRYGRWKYFLPTGTPNGKTPSFTPQLYDLKSDIGETTDVSLEHPEFAAAFLAIAAAANADIGDESHLGKNSRVTPEDLQNQRQAEVIQEGRQASATLLKEESPLN